MGEQVEIQQLFNKSWLKPLGLSTALFILYIPLGLCLLIIRAFILLQFFLLAYLLPPSKLKQQCLRIMSIVLGLVVSIDGEEPAPSKVLVANHITSLDHFAINLATNAVHPIRCVLSSFFTKTLALVRVDTLSGEFIESSENPVVVFPEGTTTNGEIGLLAFTATELPTGTSVQPISIKVSRLFLQPNFINSQIWQEIVFAMLCPYTHFTLKYLPTQIVDDEGKWRHKAQSLIAQSLGLVATKLNSSDKEEFLKRYNFRPPSLTTMTRDVQKQLSPHNIAPELIMETLQRTGSVESTVENLRKQIASGGANPPPSTFSKSATQRMLSFQERKRIMIATARQKYIQKHNLNIVA